MILHGENIKLNDTNLKLERACTVTITGDTVKTTGAARGNNHRQTLHNWKVNAQFLFDWQMVEYIRNLMQSGQKLHVVITGHAPNVSTFTFQGYAYITNLKIPAQGRGLVTIPITMQGTGRPRYYSRTENHIFKIGESKLGNYIDPLTQPYI